MKTIIKTIVALVFMVSYHTTNAQDYDFYLQKARQRIAEGDCDGAQRNYNVYKELAKKTNKEIERKLADCGTDNSTLVYSQLSEFYCDGIYDFDEPEDRNGHALHTPELMINRNHFRIVFSFYALSKEGRYNWGTQYEYSSNSQRVIMLSWRRRLGLELRSDGSIWVVTNNHNNNYPTGLSYSWDNYMGIDMEYDHGILKINNTMVKIDMEELEKTDCGFHSLDYACGGAFYGYIKDLKIYSYPD